MKLHHSYFLVIIFAGGLMTSCKKDQSLTNSSSSNSTQSNVAFQLKAVNQSAVVNRLSTITNKTNGATIKWISAVASVSMIKFEAKNNGSEVEFKSNINKTVDLFSDSNFLGNIKIPNGTFTEVEFKAQLTPIGNNPALELNAIVDLGTGNVNVIFRADENIEVKGEKANVTLTDSTLHNAITSLNMSSLVNGISSTALSNAVLTNGDLLITSSINQNLYKIIVKNLKDLNDEEDFH
jgi:hypothetical protein